ncbi:MAG: M67 family metallopeptidase [Planctomycetota bacterium]|jgi:proteasome lid subunit RPN8/RPN11
MNESGGNPGVPDPDKEPPEEGGPGEGIRFCSGVEIAPPQAREIPVKNPVFRVESKGDAAPGDCPLFVSFDALHRAVQYARAEPNREVGGFLVGGRFIDGDEEFVWIDHFLEGRHLQSHPASARFTHETFEDAWKHLDGGDPKAYSPLLLGWFHSHPGLGVFLSDRDRFIHEKFFNLPFFVALVVDPVREELLFFRWREGKVRSTGFFLVRPGLAEGTEGDSGRVESE